MVEKRNYRYSIELAVDCVLTIEERDALTSELMKLSDKMGEILGEKPVSGTANLYSERENK